MPRRQRWCGASDVTSRPSYSTRPPSTRTSPLIRLNSVVLPAPLGPRMPSVSPASTASEIASVTFSPPYDLLTACSASRAMPSALLQPRIAGGVLARVIRVEVDEAALDQEVANLEHIAPAARAPLGDAGAPP